MHPRIATKALTASTKAMPAGKLGNKMGKGSTKARKPLDWRELTGITGPLREAGALVESVAESDVPPMLPELATGHNVLRKDVARLDDAELAAYRAEVDRMLDIARNAASIRRSRARNAHADAKAVAHAIDQITTDAEVINGLFAERASVLQRTAETHDADVDTLTAQLAEADAELERRSPKGAADLSRDLDDLRRELEALKSK